MSAPRIILASLSSLCQKLSKLVEILQSTDNNNLHSFFEIRCMRVTNFCYIFGRRNEGRFIRGTAYT